MTTKTEYNIDCLNDDGRGEQNHFKIYKEFLFVVVVVLKKCKYAYDILKGIAFNDADDKIYDFDYLIKYYYDKMNDDCYSGVMRKCNELLDCPEYIKCINELIDNDNKICTKLQKRENNEIIRNIIRRISSYIESVELNIRRYTDEDFCSRCEIIYIPDPEYQEFKKVQPRICEKAKTTILKRINRDIYNRFIDTDCKKYVECFGIGIEDVYPDYYGNLIYDYPDDDSISS